MRVAGDFELPPQLVSVHRRAVRLEWLTLAYLLSVVVLMYLVMGSSQAMKVAWVEDLLSLLPPVAFLVAARYRNRPSNDRFPYGYHRCVGIAYLAASLAVLVMGVVLLGDSAMTLVRDEHPSVGLVEVVGQQVWLGWLMIPVLVYSAVPVVLLGRAKLELARELHDKVLYADAMMNKADWLTAVAAMVGVLGIGVGLWWADAAAAILISMDILRDGVGNVRTAVLDLMDRRPTTHDHRRPHPLLDRVEQELAALPWVQSADVRLREADHVLTGEVFVVPAGPTDSSLPARVQELHHLVESLDWRLHDVSVVVLGERRQAPMR